MAILETTTASSENYGHSISFHIIMSFNKIYLIQIKCVIFTDHVSKRPLQLQTAYACQFCCIKANIHKPLSNIFSFKDDLSGDQGRYKVSLLSSSITFLEIIYRLDWLSSKSQDPATSPHTSNPGFQLLHTLVLGVWTQVFTLAMAGTLSTELLPFPRTRFFK